MTYAQIKNGLVVNTIHLDDSSLSSLFSQGFDAFVAIDAVSPTPSIGWSYNGTTFTAPAPVVAPAVDPVIVKTLQGLAVSGIITADQMNVVITNIENHKS